MRRLFSDRPRTDAGPARYGEPNFSYLERSARACASVIREIIEGWLSRYPAEHADALVARLRTPEQSASAFFELYLHELLWRLQLQPSVHPELAGCVRRPDFRIRGAPGTAIVEAAWLQEGDRGYRSTQKALDQVYDALNSVNAPDFFLHIEPEGTPRTPVPLRRLRAHVETFIATLDYADVLRRVERGEYDQLPRTRFEHDGLLLCIEASPVRPESRSDPDHVPVGQIGPTAMWSDGGRRLRAAIRKKAGRYGDLAMPYVVAISVPDYAVNAHELMNALFGTLEYVVHKDPHSPGVRVGAQRRRDGAWIGGRGPVYRRVSAVLVTSELTPWTFATSDPMLVHNPWAANPMFDFAPELTHRVPKDGRFEEHRGRPVLEILGLPSELPVLIRNT